MIPGREKEKRQKSPEEGKASSLGFVMTEWEKLHQYAGKKHPARRSCFSRTENYYTIMPGTEKEGRGKWKKIEK